MNNLRYAKSSDGKYFNIPIEFTFDNLGRDQQIDEFEQDVIKNIINEIKDYDVTKFAFKDYQHTSITFTQIQIPAGPFLPALNLTIQIPTTTVETSINYEFNFYKNLTGVTASTNSDWIVDYEAAGFTDNEIYYFANNFKGSFFKLDFYDTTITEKQKAYISIIIPTQQGEKEPGFIGPPQNQKPAMVKRPKFKLDSQGADKEGYYVYWLKDRNLLDINEFYVTAKFFNAKQGQFVRMINTPQSQFIGPSIFNIDKENYYYFKYVLNYDTNEYEVFKIINTQSQKVGTINTPIKWYEYVNP